MANPPPQHNIPPSSIPSNQLPPSHSSLQNHTGQHASSSPTIQYGIKKNISHSPQLAHTNPYNNNLGQHSSNSSPAFNQPGMTANSIPQLQNQALPSTNTMQQRNYQNLASPPYVPSAQQPPKPPTMSAGAPPNTSTFSQYQPINTSAGIRPQHTMFPSVSAPSSQPMQNYSTRPSSVNGPTPPVNTMGPQISRAIVAPPSYGNPVTNYGPPVSNYGTIANPISAANLIPAKTQPSSMISGISTSQPYAPQTGFSGNFSTPQNTGIQSGLNSGVQNVQLQSSVNSQQGPPGGHTYGPPIGSVQQRIVSEPPGPTSGPPLGPPVGGSSFGPPGGAPAGLNQRPDSQQSRPQFGSNMGPPMGTITSSNARPGVSFPPASSVGASTTQGSNGPPSGPSLGPSGAQYGPPSATPYGHNFAPPTSHGIPKNSELRPSYEPPGPQNGTSHTGLQNVPSSHAGSHLSTQSGLQPGPSGPPGTQSAYPQSSMNARYPQNAPAQANYQQVYYNGPQQVQNLANQMGNMSVTQSGFNQMWGHQMFDLLQTRHILPEYPDDPPQIHLSGQFSESDNCSPEIFRCTLTRIPDTNSLLQKSRLPLGILIHPFKDLNHLPVIQCTSIVRCRACRTYINPFVYFVDAKRWKCNLCYRVNDLPEEFQYDPVSKSYGDPSRRPEIKSATIEFIAPSEYMLRPPQPAVYLFLLDVSDIACESGYLKVFCETLKANIEQLPGDARMQVGFICYDSHVHFYQLTEGLTRPRELTVIDVDDVFLPSPEGLLVNLAERKDMISDLLDYLPRRHGERPRDKSSALGAALQAAFKIMAPTGGRVSVFQTCLPNIGPGALTSREDPNARSSKEVAHLNPATDFYKRLALDCSGAQIAVDLFLLSSQYSDLATLSGISKFSGGNIQHVPVFNAQRPWQAENFKRILTRYLTRKIGFEAVMRIRCTRGLTIHTFHGNFFVRSTDLLSLPNVSPDAAFGMQLAIEESLSDLQQVCFQAALLYTSSKGERRIRVHTLCVPVASNLTEVMHSADQECIIGLLVKMAVDRAHQSSLSDAREALSHVAVDTLSAHRLAQNLPSGAHTSLLAPACLKLLCLYISAVLKHPAFRVGTSTRLDDRVAAMCEMKSLPLFQLMRSIYPALYPIHGLAEHTPQDDTYPDPPVMHLTAERINSNGAYLLDDGPQMLIYVCSSVSPAYLLDTFGVPAHSQLPDEARQLPALETHGNQMLHAFIEKLNEDKPYAASVLILKDTSPARKLFTDRLLDDRLDSSFSYYEFLQHVKSLMK